MQAPYQSVESTRNQKLHLILFIVLELIFGILIIVSLSVTWFNYCLWEFGVVNVEFLDDDYSGLHNPDTIEEIQDDTCDDDYDESALDSICEDFCDNVDQIKSASDAMITLATFTLVVIAATILVYGVRLFTERVKFKFVPFISISQFFFYLLGMILYGAIGKFTEFEDEDCPSYYDCDDYEVKAGLGLAIFIVIALLPINLYGFFFTRKAFLN